MLNDRDAIIARRFDVDFVRRMSRAEVGRWFQRLLPPCHGRRNQRECGRLSERSSGVNVNVEKGQHTQH